MTTTEYTAEGFEDETVEERMAILLDAWGVTEPDEDEDPADYEYRRNRAYELAVSYPSEISDELFAEYVAEGLVA